MRRTILLQSSLAVVALVATQAAVDAQDSAPERRDDAPEAGATGVAYRATPPAARRVDHVDTYAGEQVPDPYRWMEEMRAAETLAWSRSQDAFARAFAAAVPARPTIAERVRRIAQVRRFGTPIKGGKRYFYASFPGGGLGSGTSLLVRDSLGGEGRLLIDGDSPELAGKGLMRFVPSPDGRFVAYALTSGGSQWETWRIRGVATGEDLGEILTGLQAARSAVTWAPDGTGFYYERFELPDEAARQSELIEEGRIMFHRAGTDQERDQLVFARPGRKDWTVTHGLTRDGRVMAVTAKPGSEPGNLVYAVDLTRRAKPVELVADAGAVFTFVGGQGSTLWFQTDRDAPRGRVVAFDLKKPTPSDGSEVIPEAAETIDTWVGVSAIGERFVVGYLEDARLTAKIFDLDGRFEREIRLPWLGSIWSGFVGRLDDAEAFYTLSGLVDPGSVYRLDVRTGESALFTRPDLGYDPDDFVTEQVLYTSADGTRVPMFLVYKRGLKRDGRAPAYMYGYGAGAWSAAPWFQPQMVPWLERGGLWALPNTRGGGEYGESWHRAGSVRNKPVATDDYLAAGEWLVRNRYTTPARLVANGSSAGGPVVGAAILRRPDLFGAAVLDFPALDMLRYDQFTGAQAWRYEFGTPGDPGDFKVLRGYSPVHNVRSGACYPPTLVAPGERDEITPPFHAYKFVAALQAAQGCANPVLLRVSWGGGHAYGASLDDSIENWSDQLAFLIQVLGLEGRILQTPGEASARSGAS